MDHGLARIALGTMALAALPQGAHAQCGSGCGDEPQWTIEAYATQGRPKANDYDGPDAPEFRDTLTRLGGGLAVLRDAGIMRLGGRIEGMPGRVSRFDSRVPYQFGSLRAIIEERCDSFVTAAFTAEIHPAQQSRLDPFIGFDIGIGHEVDRLALGSVSSFNPRNTLVRNTYTFPTGTGFAGANVMITDRFGFHMSAGYRISPKETSDCRDCFDITAAQRYQVERFHRGPIYRFGVNFRAGK